MAVEDLGITDADAPPADEGERSAPHDLLAEQSTVGALLLDGGRRDGIVDEVLEILSGPDFYIPKHEVIFEAVARLHRLGKPVDVIAVTDELTKAGELRLAGHADYLHTLTGIVPTAANAGYYASIVAEKAVLRRLVEAGTRIQQMGYASEGRPADLVAAAAHEVGEISLREHARLQMIGSDMLGLFQKLETAPTYIPSGWQDLDDRIGGFGKGELAVIAARPGDGKSIVLLQLAARLSSGGSIALSSLEMTQEALQLRLLAMFASVHLTKLRKRTMTPEDWIHMAEVRQRIEELPIFVDYREKQTIDSIRAHARAVARDGELGAVMVDYAQLVDGPGESRFEIVTNVAKGFSAMAKELNVPVVVAAQLGRPKTPGRRFVLPTMEQLRESGQIEQEASLVLLQSRDRENKKHDHELHIVIAKNRNGETTRLRLLWKGEYARIDDLPWSPTRMFDDDDLTVN